MKPRATRHNSDGAEAGGDLDDGVDEDEAGDGPVGAAVVVEPRQRVGPRVAGRRVEDGREGLVEHVQPVRRPELRHRHHRRCPTSRGDGCVRDAGGAGRVYRVAIEGRDGAGEGREGAGVRWKGGMGQGCAGRERGGRGALKGSEGAGEWRDGAEVRWEGARGQGFRV